MQEQWTRWEPIVGLAGKYYLESIADTFDGFKAFFFDAKNHNKKIQVIFEDSVHSYIRTDESCRSDLIFRLKNQYGSEFYATWTFFKVTNSEYLRWLSEQSCTFSDYLKMQHFSFITMDFILDIVTNYEPRVEFINTSIGCIGPFNTN